MKGSIIDVYVCLSLKHRIKQTLEIINFVLEDIFLIKS